MYNIPKSEFLEQLRKNVDSELIHVTTPVQSAVIQTTFQKINKVKEEMFEFGYPKQILFHVQKYIQPA